MLLKTDDYYFNITEINNDHFNLISGHVVYTNNIH